MKKILIQIVCVSVAIALLLVLIQTIVAGTDSRFSFDGLIKKLDTKEIAEGDAVRSILDPRLGKPVADVYREDEKGKKFGMMAYMYENQTLLIYWCEESIYAACLIKGIKTSEEKWYFCNIETFNEYLKMALPQSSASPPSADEQ